MNTTCDVCIDSGKQVIFKCNDCKQFLCYECWNKQEDVSVYGYRGTDRGYLVMSKCDKCSGVVRDQVDLLEERQKEIDEMMRENAYDSGEYDE